MVSSLDEAMYQENLIGLDAETIVGSFPQIPIYGIDDSSFLIIHKEGPILCEFKENKCVHALWMPFFSLDQARKDIFNNEQYKNSILGLSEKEIRVFFPRAKIKEIGNGLQIILPQGVVSCLFKEGICIDVTAVKNDKLPVPKTENITTFMFPSQPDKFQLMKYLKGIIKREIL